MAVVRARSAPPYGLIAFIVLWVISTVLAVLFYVRASQAQQEADSANRAFEHIATRTEQTGIGADLRNNAGPADRTQTALRIAVNEIETLKAKISGSPTTPYAQVVADADSALKAAQRASLKDAVQSLDSERNTKGKSYTDLRTQFDDLSKQIADANSRSRESVSSLEKQVDDLRKQLEAANDSVTKSEGARNEAVAKGQADLDKARSDYEDQARKGLLQLQQAQAEIKKLQQQNAELIGLIKPKNPGSQVGEPDGQIVKVDAASNEVYINLTGTRDHIAPGQTFTVYDPRVGVRYGTDEDAAGKGSIEVIEPGENASLCRVTHVAKGQSFQAGDMIADIIYHNSRNRPMRFVIVGQFDLDGDGVATADERDRLIRLITARGGIVDKQITTQTDYLVAGERPTEPSILSATPPATGSATDERAKLQSHYDEDVVEAKRLSIPVLNANRFLSMMGYYSTTIIRY